MTFDRNIIARRSFQADGAPVPAGQGDEGQAPAGNHDGGVITFGPDGKLYIVFGDQGRRGLMQNLASGPTAAGTPDDQFGGPDPDDNHLSGVILRLNPDGSAPDDNPFAQAASTLTGAAAVNLRKVFAFGFRNSFGMAFDPFSGNLWMSEHGDDTFDELNMVRPGMNGGWVQVAGPLSRLSEFREIESTFFPANQTFPALQQWRWPPSRLAAAAAEVRQRLATVGGSVYSDPQFSWRWAFLPTALAFAPRNFGRDMAGHMIVAAAGNAMGSVGYLLRFPVHMSRRLFEFSSSRLVDRVADNTAKFDATETQELIIGSGFGIVTDLKMSPRNTMYAVSLSRGAIYEISRTAAAADGDDDPDIAGVGTPISGVFTSSSGSNAAGAPSGSVQIRLNSGRELFCYEVNSINVTTSGRMTVRQRSGGSDAAVLDFQVNEQGPVPDASEQAPTSSVQSAEARASSTSVRADRTASPLQPSRCCADPSSRFGLLQFQLAENCSKTRIRAHIIESRIQFHVRKTCLVKIEGALKPGK